MKKRVFIGIKISKDLVKKIEIWKKNFISLKVRWLSKENMHLTLLPPWYVENLEPLISKLKAFKTTIKPFELLFTHISFGPNPKYPRLIWASGEASGDLIDLKSDLEKYFQQKSEKRDFLPHLTLARFQQRDFSSFGINNLNERINWREKVESVTLYQSFLGRFGADYEKLSEVLL